MKVEYHIYSNTWLNRWFMPVMEALVWFILGVIAIAVSFFIEFGAPIAIIGVLSILVSILYAFHRSFRVFIDRVMTLYSRPDDWSRTRNSLAASQRQIIKDYLDRTATSQKENLQIQVNDTLVKYIDISAVDNKNKVYRRYAILPVKEKPDGSGWESFVAECDFHTEEWVCKKRITCNVSNLDKKLVDQILNYATT